jgi:hypothetical protein
MAKIHNSPLRGPEFVTRKITLGITKILNGELDCLRFLLRNYPQAVAISDHSGETPLTMTSDILMRRLLLMIRPQLNFEEYHEINYSHRRLGLFLAHAAINADGIPNIFSRLRSNDEHLLYHVLSYL